MVAVGGFLSVAVEASPWLGAFGKRDPAHLNPAVVGAQSYNLYVAPVPGPDRKVETGFPEPRLISVPVTAGVYDAGQWRVRLTKGNDCYLPEFSLLNVAGASGSRVYGVLMWPSHQQATPPRLCADRVLPEDNLCPNGQPPAVPACPNGATVLIDLTSVIGPDGKSVSPEVHIKNFQDLAR